jgi:hypothetical protein
MTHTIDRGTLAVSGAGCITPQIIQDTRIYIHFSPNEDPFDPFGRL